MSGSSELETWSIPRLKRLIPLDDTSLREIITYTATLSKPAAADHLKNLLGDDGPALEFIASFNSRRKAGDGGVASAGAGTGVGSSVTTTGVNDRGGDDDDGHVPARNRQGKHGGAKKSKSGLHSAGPVRLPQGHGDVAGGYTKQYDGGREKVHGKFATTDALHLPTASNAVAGSVGSSRDVSPAPGKNAAATKLPPSASGNLISDFGFANVRSKQAKKPQGHASHQQYNLSGSQPQSGTSTPVSGGKARTTTTTTTSSVSDLTSAIAALELSTNPSLSTHRRKCTCNASIHPLFTTAPNCLNCGKIICALEGLQPCSFCDGPILTNAQVQEMIRALKDERGIEKMVAHNIGQQSQHSGRGTPTMTPFNGAGTPTDSGDEAIARATAHRDKLLAFQRENAQRTKIHDEAADYDSTLTTGATQWMTPLQRAAALKKQQKYLREMEEENKPEWEKKRTVLSVGIKNGKLVRTYEKAPRERDKDKEDDETGGGGGDGGGDEDDVLGKGVGHELSVGRTGKGAFSDNPLLASGKLIRPLWKAPEDDPSGKGKGKGQDVESDRERKSVWRRVQDDNEDNEQWILTGGLHGFAVEDRKMEDGSQQECG